MSYMDLGVIVSSDLTPSNHRPVLQITVKAHQFVNCILRCFVSGDTNLYDGADSN